MQSKWKSYKPRKNPPIGLVYILKINNVVARRMFSRRSNLQLNKEIASGKEQGTLATT
jgi:hypothetical protein